MCCWVVACKQMLQTGFASCCSQIPTYEATLHLELKLTPVERDKKPRAKCMFILFDLRVFSFRSVAHKISHARHIDFFRDRTAPFDTIGHE